MELWAPWGKQPLVKRTRVPRLAWGWQRRYLVGKLVLGQCLPASSSPRPCLGVLPPAWWRNVLVSSVLSFQGVCCSWWQLVVLALLAFRSCCQALEELIVPPGVSPLRKEGLAACHDVLESCCSWAEGTVRSSPYHWWRLFCLFWW